MRSKRHTLTLTDLGEFWSELALLRGSDMALSEALEVLAQDQEKPVMRRLLADIRDRMAQGESLVAALAAHPRHFPPFLTERLVRVEGRDRECEVLESTAVYLETLELRETDLGDRLRTSLLYPFLLLALVLLVTAFLLYFVVPVFADLFQGLGAVLPAPTRWVLEISGFLVAWGPLLGLGILFLVLGHVFDKRRRGARAPSAVLLDRLALAMPGFGQGRQWLTLSRLLHTWSFVLEQGEGADRALVASAQMIDHPVYVRLLEKIAATLASGASFAEALRNTPSPLLPKKLRHVVEVGERSGKSAYLFDRLADFYLRRARLALEPAARLFHLLVTLLLALVAGFVVIAMYLPIFQIGQVF